jgi:hypothetical protein
MDINKLLYADETGELVGFDEVQYLDPIPVARIPLLIQLLQQDNLFIVCEAALLLTSWGVDEGIAALNTLMSNKIHESIEFAPHRITGKDNIYDEFAHSVHLYLLSGGNKLKAIHLFKALLDKYAHFFFESKLKRALMKNIFHVLEPNIQVALEKSFQMKLFFQSSQLLPVLMQLNKERGGVYVQSFLNIARIEPKVEENIAQALRYIKTHDAMELLKRYSRSSSILVKEQALESLKILNNS